MKELTVDEHAAGRRLDKFLFGCLPGAPVSLVYAQLRKKNITLNGSRATGRESLETGDRIQCFFSDATWEKFAAGAPITPASVPNQANDKADSTCGESYHTNDSGSIDKGAFLACYHAHPEVRILWEDWNILIAEKPVGLLSQKAYKHDESLCEWVIGYLLERGEITDQTLVQFKPAACHRLDRNTGGIVVCAKTLSAARTISQLLKERRLNKYYLALVHGRIEQGGITTASFSRDAALNRTQIIRLPEAFVSDTKPPENSAEATDGTDAHDPATRREASKTAVTAYEPVCHYPPELLREHGFSPMAKNGELTLVCAHLITGRTHQLRAQFADLSHPLVGDRKYGGPLTEKDRQIYGCKWQMLHAGAIVFPDGSETALPEALRGRTIISFPEHPVWQRFLTDLSADDLHAAINRLS